MLRQCLSAALATLVLSLSLRDCSGNQRVLEEKCSLCDNYDKTAMVFTDESLTTTTTCENMNVQLAFLTKDSSECSEALPSIEAACGCVEKCSLCDSYNKTATACANDDCTETTSCENMSFLLGHMSKNSSECSENLPFAEVACGCVEKCSLCDNYDKTAMVFTDESLTTTTTCENMNAQLGSFAKSSSDCSELLPFVEGSCGCVDKNVEKCKLCENYNKTATTFLDDEKKFEVTCEKAMSVVGGVSKGSKACNETLPALQVSCGCKEPCVFCSGGVPKNPNATIGPFPNSGLPKKQTCLEFGAELASVSSDSEDCGIQNMVAETCGCPFDPKAFDYSPSMTLLSQCRFIIVFLGFFSLWW